MDWLQGKKTYIVALAMLINALVPLLTGEMALGELDFRGILEAFGLATLRAGVAKA